MQLGVRVSLEPRQCEWMHIYANDRACIGPMAMSTRDSVLVNQPTQASSLTCDRQKGGRQSLGPLVRREHVEAQWHAAREPLGHWPKAAPHRLRKIHLALGISIQCTTHCNASHRSTSYVLGLSAFSRPCWITCVALA